MRLTEKDKMARYGYKYVASNRFDNFGEGCNKLGQLEDIEEELEIDLITFLKVVLYGCYVKDKWCDEENKISHFYFSNYYDDYFLLKYRKNCDEHIFYFKDYGKTWALTKEELL